LGRTCPDFGVKGSNGWGKKDSGKRGGPQKKKKKIRSSVNNGKKNVQEKESREGLNKET